MALVPLGASTVSAAPPLPVEEEEVNLSAGVVCDFPVDLLLSGKSKVIEHRAGSIRLSPGLHVIVVNRAQPEKRVRLSITGASHVSTLPDGTVKTVFTGRNLNFDPEAGFVLAVGRFSIVKSADDATVLQPLAGQGRLLPVCPMIA
jgi:hypothetical protein